MKLFNPSGTSLSMRGIDGILKTADGQVLSTFISPPFVVKPGDQFFDLIFTINSPEMKSWFNKFFVNSKEPLTLIVKKKLPFFTTYDESQINIQSLIADSLF
jgi:LEA14-like dessication related protein